MSGPLLEVVAQRFSVALDPDSDGGRLLAALTPRPPFDSQATSGQADLAPLTIVPRPGGVTVRAVQGGDLLTISLPAGPLDFKLFAPAPGSPMRVEIELVPITVPLPFLGAATKAADGALTAAAGAVELHLPPLVLVVRADAPPASTVLLAPATNAAGALEVTMTPPTALIGPGAALGLEFERGSIAFDAPGGAEIKVPDLVLHVAPPGIPALTMRGAAHDLRISLAPGGGVSGDFTLALDDGAAAPARPRFLNKMAAHVRLDNSSVTKVELTGSIDVAGEVSQRLGQLDEPPSAIEYTLGLALDAGWRAALALTASGGDGAALWRTGPNDPAPLRNTLGAYAVFTPLLASNLPVGNGYVELALGAGVAAGLAASGAVETDSVIVRGGQLVVRQPVAGAPEAFLLLDLETELRLDVAIGGTSIVHSERPLKVRHRAIGFRLDFGPDGGAPALKPVFDPQQGFALDIADPGFFHVPDPIGSLVQPEGARVAKENPIHFEVDLVMKADLGIVTVDKATVRAPLDPVGPPTLTALGAHLDAGALSGGGYLKIGDGGFSGSLDAALPSPIGLRANAGLAIAKAADPDGGTVDAVLATLGLELPVPIPLANSGLGLFGFAGLLGVNFARDQHAGETALDWLKRVGQATNPAGWHGVADSWAFGVGAVIGTVEGGFVFNAKGMLVLEAPGPRLLLVMKANLLTPRPSTGGQDAGVLTAVIDIGRDSIDIGVIAEYTALKPLLELRAPAEAFFDFQDTSNWFLDVGALPPKLPVSVKFLLGLTADGYLMLHGSDIAGFPEPGQKLIGPAVAAGVEASLTWGPKPIGLYLEIGAKAAVGLSFDPLVVLGILRIRGELHLFIVSVEASADAEVIIAPPAFFISARVCGKVDFFFFDVSGCVKLELGERPSKLPDPNPLVRAVSLHNRTPALLRATASDGPVDGSIGDAARVDAGGEVTGAVPVVPLDAIPVVQFDMRTAVGPGCSFLGTPIGPKLGPNEWSRRGERFYRYTLTSLDLSPTPGPGAKPAVWWDGAGLSHPGDDPGVQLALLDWTPDPTPSAALRTTSVDERVVRRWGSVCLPVAPPTAVLWGFDLSPPGPSPTGWSPHGVPAPDPPGAARSIPPDTRLGATEGWRIGQSFADALPQLTPGYVFDGRPGRLLVAPRTGAKLGPAVPDDELFQQLFDALVHMQDGALCDSVRLDAGAGFEKARLLLMVDGRVRDGQLVLRPFDADGNQTDGDTSVAPSAQRVHPQDLPGEWLDPVGPWTVIVQGALDAFKRFEASTRDDYLLVLVEAAPPRGTTRLEIGLVDDVEGAEPSWGLLVVEALTGAEVARGSYDSEERDREVEVVNGALGADASTRALLKPDTAYTVAVGYDVAVAPADDHGQPDASKAESHAGLSQRFRFQTAKDPPARLDPWILATDPGPAEGFFFHGEPLRVVFSTNATRALFKAYGYDLFAVAKAASGVDPSRAPAFEHETVPTTHALPPFDSALLEVALGLPCLSVSGQEPRHVRVNLPLALEPSSGYILDFEARRPDGTSLPASPHPLFRRHFDTSRYASPRAMAAAVDAATVRHRRVADAGPVRALGGGGAVAVTDEALEQALRAVRWGELTRPSEPRVTLVWSDPAGGASQSAPAAVLVETPEPLWRVRDVPKEASDAQGTRWFELRPEQWLDVVESSGGLVAALVHTTDGARTLALLRPGIGVASLVLQLRRTHHPLFEGDGAAETARLVSVTLPPAAPWEVAAA